MPSVRWIDMALATWERDPDAEPRGPGSDRLRCLVDLDAPCNLACQRCQRPVRGRRLTQDQALELVEVLAAEVIAAGVRSASAVFYGGEPLLAREQLLAQARSFCGALRGAGVECELGLITNGTRLDAGTIQRLVRAGFTRVSVTIAGTRVQHESRRKAHGNGPTYRVILDNLDAARRALEVMVRYELREDADLMRLPDFVSELQQRGLLGGERPVKVVAQPPRTYAAQAHALFAPRRLRLVEGGKVRRGDADP